MDTDRIVDRAEFEKELKLMYSKRRNSNKPWSQEKLVEVISFLIECQIPDFKKTSQHRHYESLYDLVKIVSSNYMVYLKRENPQDLLVQKISMEEFYPKLMDAHLKTGHGGRDKLLHYAEKLWVITKDACSLFVSMCKTCSRKKTAPKAGVVIKPIISDDFNMRGQVDLIDFQSCPDGDYKFLMNYQDHFSKFLHLRPLKSKHAVNVAGTVLLYIYQFFQGSFLKKDFFIIPKFGNLKKIHRKFFIMYFVLSFLVNFGKN